MTLAYQSRDFLDEDFEMVESSDILSRLHHQDAAINIKWFIERGSMVDVVYEYMQFANIIPTAMQSSWLSKQKGKDSKALLYLADLANSKMNDAPPPPKTAELFDYLYVIRFNINNFQELLEYFATLKTGKITRFIQGWNTKNDYEVLGSSRVLSL